MSSIPWSNSDQGTCPWATIKVYDASGTTELASYTYASATHTFPSSSQGSISYKIKAFESGGNSVEATMSIHICGAETA